MQTVQVSVINTVFTLVAIWMIEKAGRKTLWMVGTSIQIVALSLAGCTFFFHGDPKWVVVGVMGLVAGHAIGNGSIIWVFLSEIFPTKVRGRAMSITITSLWIFSYLGNQIFPLMVKHLGNHGTFWVFGFMALVNLLVVTFFVPETRGHSLESISKMFQTKRKVGELPLT